jgi:transposase
MDDKQRMKDLRRRRVQGARLLESGVPPAEVARRVGVSRQSVMRWERAIESGGIDRVKRLGSRGRPPRLSDTQLLELARLLKQGSISTGYATEIWTLGSDASEEACELPLALHATTLQPRDRILETG